MVSITGEGNPVVFSPESGGFFAAVSQLAVPVRASVRRLIYETSHRHTPLLRFEIKAADKKPADFWRVVAVLGHFLSDFVG